MRVAVFIDDLDRCQGTYVIELLEGIQTLFKEAQVVFVVTADRRWLNACYSDAYRDFKEIVHEPGKPLGTLFLEKAFQFATPVPGIPDELKDAYWRELVQVQRDGRGHSADEARRNADTKMRERPTEGAILDLVNESRGKDFAEQRAIREAAVVRLASPEIVERTEHALLPFAVLLDPNPRAMKRLVNSYSVNRAIAILSHVDIERNDLILWTVISLRWPELAEYLEENPEKITPLLSADKSTLPDHLASWCCDDEVLRVLTGEPVNRGLTQDVVRKCAALWV
jgi:hypothetical protein